MWCTALALLASSAAFAGVTVTSPISGSTTASPVHFVASASSNHPITYMMIYVDNTSAYGLAANSINTNLNMSMGAHSVVVQSWDSAGQVAKSSLSLNVITSSGVTVSSPANGSTAASPVHFVASATSSHPITFMEIYVDGNGAFGQATSSLSTYLNMSQGSHSVVIQAWDSTGAVFKQALNMTVSAPTNGTVFSQIEDMTGWQNCDACAGPNGQGPTVPHWMAQFQTTPSLDGSSAEFFLGGSTAYAAALWWKQLGPIDTVTHMVYDTSFFFTDANAPQALEFDVNQSVNGKKYIFGTECDFLGTRHWRIWDSVLHWLDSGVTCASAQTPNVWHNLKWEFERTADGHTHFIAVTVDGNRQIVNRYQTAQAASVRELNIAFQMDGRSPMIDYYVWIDKATLTVW